ncbi:MAG: Smr/MutS family protein [Legionellales bacterium]
MTDDRISDEDKALFRAQMRAVKPLNKQSKRASSPDIKPSECKQTHRIPEQTTYFLSDYIQETVHSETLLSYCTSSIPSMRFRSLRKGEIPWEARLDLHGLNIEQARLSLCDFINTQSHNNKRCVLIIHGKGGHQGQPPVIKNQVNRWLPQFEEVQAYHSAQAKDGGYGAMYVLLKPKNKAGHNS